MSRLEAVESRVGRSFPRVSGDEPMRVVPFVGVGMFSPRERG